MLRFGTITEVYPEKGTARVKFEEDGIVTAPIPVSQISTGADKFFALPSPGDQVACLMDEHAETGVVIGSIYSGPVSVPEGVAAGNVAIVFEDGTRIVYDKAGPKISIEIDGDVEIKCNLAKVDGDLEVTGKIDVAEGIDAGGAVAASGQVTAFSGSPAQVGLSTHIHPTPAGPTTPPTPGT